MKETLIRKKKHHIYFVYFCKNVQVESYLWVKPDQYQYEHTKSNIAVVQQVAEMIKHGFLVMATDSTEITQETTAVCNHLREHDFLNEARESELSEDPTGVNKVKHST